ncbi:hypothetical protein PQX77_002259 [Marasmius sp. AFHP31]|nr:hypothetical protein PQX77_002259 [Marasmius sp. AFHP31]
MYRQSADEAIRRYGIYGPNARICVELQGARYEVFVGYIGTTSLRNVSVAQIRKAIADAYLEKMDPDVLSHKLYLTTRRGRGITSVDHFDLSPVSDHIRSQLITILKKASSAHDTTTAGGNHIKDPNGWHLTFCYKNEIQVANNTHTACHGYIPSKTDFTFVKATHAGQKADATLKRNGKPAASDLEEAPDVGYSHL